MENNNHIPESDQELARRVGAVLQENRSILSIDDPIIDQIIDYKKGLYTAFEDEIIESRQKSWEKVSSVIRKDQSKNSSSTKPDKSDLKVIGTRRKTFLKAAAAILVAALLSIFIFTQVDFNQPEIVVQSGSNQMTYTLGDESQVKLRPHSSLTILERSEDVVRYKLEGEAFFNVTKDQNRRFLVDAGPGVIEVTGTSFNIREWSGETIVYLKDGSLSLNSSKTSEEILLNPGEVATINSNFEISEPVQTNGNEFISWQQDEMIFNNRSVESIIKELEYHYSIDIRVPDRLQNEVLGGTLSLESRTISLENLGIVLGGNFSSIGNDTYQFVE